MVAALPLAFLWALAPLWAAHCGAATVPSDLTLADALRAAADHNPALRASAFDLRAIEGRRQQAGTRSNPELSLELENFGGSGEVSGTDALESTLALSQLIELGGKRRLRIAATDSELDVARIEQAIQRLDIQAEVARRFIRVVADQEQLSVARRSSELTRDWLAAITQRVDAARSPVAERSRASIASGRAELEEAQASRALETSRRALAATWGETEAHFSTAHVDLQRLPPVETFEVLVGRLPSNPDLARYLSELRLRDSELRLARATRSPDLTLGGGIRRFEATGDNAFVLSFSMPLPLVDRREGAIAEARARLDKVSVAQEAALLDANSRLFELYQQLLQSRAEAEALQQKLIPLAREALTQTVSGYERGRFSYLEVTEAQRELIDLHRARIEATASYHLVLNEIERLTSEPLVVPMQP